MLKKDINEMSYVEFISLLNETNRCPGGKETINWLLRNTFANSNTKVLEIGSNTGFSSLEVARTVKCKTLGIDPVQVAVESARKELLRDTSEIQELVDFQVASAYDIPAKDASFDLIIAGGSTSFMDNKEKAISEMWRVLKPWGFLTVTNLFYYTSPPDEIIQKIGEIIGVDIKPRSAEDWMEIYMDTGKFEQYKFSKTQLSSNSEQRIDSYVEFFMAKPHIQALSDEDQRKVQKRWKEILVVFNENHKYLGFIKGILRKRQTEEEPELFLPKT